MNKIILIGNSSKDVELETKGETKFARINLAVSRKFDRDITDWFNCTCFGALAEKVASVYIKKGTKVCITGRLEFNEIEKDSVKTKHHSVIVEDLELVGGKNNAEENKTETELTPVDDESLPF